MVYGFGEAKTPEPFVKACDKFIYTEILRTQGVTEPAAQSDKAQATPGPIEGVGKQPAASSSSSPVEVPVEFIANILDDIAEEDGWAPLAMLGTTISKVSPEFDSRLYGHTKLSGLIRSQSKWFDLDTRGASPTGGAVWYVRNKNRAPDQQAR